MQELFEALLNPEQDPSVRADTRMQWALWVISKDDPRLLNELAWRFASERYDKMPAESQEGMKKIRRYLDGNKSIDIHRVQAALWTASYAAYAWMDAESLVDGWAFAADTAAWTTWEAATAQSAEEAAEHAYRVSQAAADVFQMLEKESDSLEETYVATHLRQLEIIREVVVEKGNLT
jgi:hypothetical protein